MAKVKMNVKEVLMKKGEYVAIGVSALFLLIMLVLGVSTAGKAINGKEIAQKLNSAAKQAEDAAAVNTTAGAEAKVTDSAEKLLSYSQVEPGKIQQQGLLYIPTPAPETKRDNPFVYPIEEFQVDLIRAPMKGYDIYYPEKGDPMIAFRVKAPEGKINIDKATKDAAKSIKDKAKRAQGSVQNANNAGSIPRGGSGSGPSGGTPGMAPPGGAPPGLPPPPGGGSGYNPYGQFGEGSAMPGSALRPADETTQIVYITLTDKAYDDAIAAGKQPAMTLVPLRMVVVQGSFPLKAQREEIRRALRLRDISQVANLPKFEGYEVRRRVITPDGTVWGRELGEDGVEDPKKPLKEKPYASLTEAEKREFGWGGTYPHLDKYVATIGARKMSDHHDIIETPKREGTKYLPYFLRYEEQMAMPLPELVGDPEQVYPEVKLPTIANQIAKWVEERRPKLDTSKVAQRLAGKAGDNPFIPTNPTATGAGSFGFGKEFNAPMTPLAPPNAAPPGMSSQPGKGPASEGGTEAPAALDPDFLLIRFIDTDVQPGYRYQYQIRVKMANPNYRDKKDPTYEQVKALLNKETDIDIPTLKGQWRQVGESLIVPSEAFVYAGERTEYNEKLLEAYGMKDKKDKLLPIERQPREVPDEKLPAWKHQTLFGRLESKVDQVLIEVHQWREEVRTEAGGTREPVGNWIVAEMPVGRGQYVGKKAFVKLPLWSSASNGYTLRAVPAQMVYGKTQPQGWLVDFRSQNILVDFHGGAVELPRTNLQPIKEDVAAELLIVRSDGALSILNSSAAAEDTKRKERLDKWTQWIKDTEKGITAGSTPTTKDPKNPFERQP